MEVNPLAGLNPVHSDLPMISEAFGVSYVELIRQIVQSASRRIGPPRIAPRLPAQGVC